MYDYDVVIIGGQEIRYFNRLVIHREKQRDVAILQITGINMLI